MSEMSTFAKPYGIRNLAKKSQGSLGDNLEKLFGQGGEHAVAPSATPDV